jgi:hypothetical protein
MSCFALGASCFIAVKERMRLLFCHACWSDTQKYQGVVIPREILTHCVLTYRGYDIIELTAATTRLFVCYFYVTCVEHCI